MAALPGAAKSLCGFGTAAHVVIATSAARTRTAAKMNAVVVGLGVISLPPVGLII
jgi:hypothetical protein